MSNIEGPVLLSPLPPPHPPPKNDIYVYNGARYGWKLDHGRFTWQKHKGYTLSVVYNIWAVTASEMANSQKVWGYHYKMKGGTRVSDHP